ncbi:MAG: hypothetical protein Q4C98_08100 [Capnocytophaga sp.]|nr:hypothetical protein [Capnocytophaga sp.]
MIIVLTLLFWLPLSLFWLGIKRTFLINQYVLFGFCIVLIVIALRSLFSPRPERYDIPSFAFWGVIFAIFTGFIICFQTGILVYQYFNNQTIIKSNGYFLIMQVIIILLSLWISTNDYSFRTNSKNQLDKSPLYTPKDTLIKRYFLGNSALHKQKSDKPIYLYDEISEEEALKHQHERAYFVGFYRNDTLVGYQKIFRSEILMEVNETDIKAKK